MSICDWNLDECKSWSLAEKLEYWFTNSTLPLKKLVDVEYDKTNGRPVFSHYTGTAKEVAIDYMYAATGSSMSISFGADPCASTNPIPLVTYKCPLELDGGPVEGVSVGGILPQRDVKDIIKGVYNRHRGIPNCGSPDEKPHDIGNMESVLPVEALVTILISSSSSNTSVTVPSNPINPAVYDQNGGEHSPSDIRAGVCGAAATKHSSISANSHSIASLSPLIATHSALVSPDDEGSSPYGHTGMDVLASSGSTSEMENLVVSSGTHSDIILAAAPISSCSVNCATVSPFSAPAVTKCSTSSCMGSDSDLENFVFPITDSAVSANVGTTISGLSSCHVSPKVSLLPDLTVSDVVKEPCNVKNTDVSKKDPGLNVSAILLASVPVSSKEHYPDPDGFGDSAIHLSHGQVAPLESELYAKPSVLPSKGSIHRCQLHTFKDCLYYHSKTNAHLNRAGQLLGVPMSNLPIPVRRLFLGYPGKRQWRYLAYFIFLNEFNYGKIAGVLNYMHSKKFICFPTSGLVWMRKEFNWIQQKKPNRGNAKYVGGYNVVAGVYKDFNGAIMSPSSFKHMFH